MLLRRRFLHKVLQLLRVGRQRKGTEKRDAVAACSEETVDVGEHLGQINAAVREGGDEAGGPQAL
jgi:hypothetical protein